jgi:hypothetical protein
VEEMVSEKVFLVPNSVSIFTSALILSAETAFIISYILESVCAGATTVNSKHKMYNFFINKKFRPLKYKRKKRIDLLNMFSFKL